MRSKVEIEPPNLGGWRHVIVAGRVVGRIRESAGRFVYYRGRENVLTPAIEYPTLDAVQFAIDAEWERWAH